MIPFSWKEPKGTRGHFGMRFCFSTMEKKSNTIAVMAEDTIGQQIKLSMPNPYPTQSGCSGHRIDLKTQNFRSGGRTSISTASVLINSRIAPPNN